MTDTILDLLKKYENAFDGITVHVTTGRSKSVQLDGLDVETIDTADDKTVLVRALKEGKAASASFSGAGAAEIEAFLESNSRVIDSLPADANRCIPAFTAAAETYANADAAFDTVTAEDLINIAADVTRTAMGTDAKVKAVKQSTASASFKETLIISTAGPVLKRVKTLFSAGAYLIASDGTDERDGYDSVLSTRLDMLDSGLAGKTAAENACSLLGAKSINTGKYHIAFSPAVMVDFIELLLDLTDAESVYKGISMLCGKLGAKAASEGFTLTDDPLTPDGVSSRSFDDEGQSCEKLRIFSNGTLENYLHNSYTAKALGMANNARAVMTGGGGLAIGSTNISLDSTHKGSPSDICSEHLYVTEVMGMHTADPVSGDFSVGISGIVIKNGGRAFPFKEAVLAGNLADLLGGMIHVFDNRRTFGNITTSDTLFEKMSVSGV